MSYFLRGKPTEQGYLNDARELISTMANPKTGLFNAEGEVSHRSLRNISYILSVWVL